MRPILRQHCFVCHGADLQQSDLALDSYASAMAGGAGGEALQAGEPGGSRLWLMITHQETPMPPGGDKLPQEELDVIEAWIMGGLLENAGSKPQPMRKSTVAEFTPAADNRPAGDPAMPEGVYCEPVVVAEKPGAIAALATSPWAPLAAIAGPRQISLYHTESAELLGVLPFLEGTPYVLRFSRDGSLLVAGGGRDASLGVVALYDVKSGHRLETFGDELDAVLAADLRADHSLVALGGPRKVVRVYRVADGQTAYEITKHTDWITALEFSPDGQYLVTGDRGGGLLLWDAATGRERGDFRGHSEQITAVAWRSDSGVLASASEDNTVRLWQPDGEQIKSWNAHDGGVLSVAFAGTGELVTAGRDHLVKTWKSDGSEIGELATADDIALHAQFTHEGRQVVFGDWAGNVRLYETQSGERVAALDPNPPSLDARLAAAAAEVAEHETAVRDAQQKLEAAEAVRAAVAARREAFLQARQKLDDELAAAQAKLEEAKHHIAEIEARQAELAAIEELRKEYAGKTTKSE